MKQESRDFNRERFKVKKHRLDLLPVLKDGDSPGFRSRDSLAIFLRGLRTYARRFAEEAHSSTEKAREGEQLSRQTGVILDRIVSVSERTKEQMEQVVVATDQQSQAATELATRSQDILNVLQKSAQDVTRTSQGTLAANSLLEALRVELGRYRINADTELTLDLSKTDHFLWRQRVHAVLAGRLELRPEQVGSHRDRRFGKWYGGDGQARFGDKPIFRELDEPHQEVHRLARAIAEAHGQRDQKKAVALLAELDRNSERLVVGWNA